MPTNSGQSSPSPATAPLKDEQLAGITGVAFRTPRLRKRIIPRNLSAEFDPVEFLQDVCAAEASG